MRGLLIIVFLTFVCALSAGSAEIHEAAKKGDLAALTTALGAEADVNNGVTTEAHFQVLD